MTDGRPSDCTDRIARLERRSVRERTARVEAEKTAERGLRTLYERQMDSMLVGRIAARANDAHDPNDAIEIALDGVLERTGWSFGSVAFLADDGEHLEPVRLTRSSDDALAPLVAFVQANGVGPGDDPIRVAIREHRAVVSRILIASDTTLSRRLTALKCGMRSSAAVPLLSNGAAFAVMEFMSPVEGAPQEGLLDVLMQIGAQIARVHERRVTALRLQHDALHDPLTGLPNRQLFTDRQDRALAMKRRGHGYTVLFVDLDRFKAVNETFGHAVGDAVLLNVAQSLQAAIRSRGLASRATVARAGGDEFFLLIEADPSRELISSLADGIVADMAKPMSVAATQVHIGASIGIVEGGEAFGDSDAVVRAVELAMHDARSAGHSQARWYTGIFEAQECRQETLVAELRAAHGNGFLGFEVVFQPIVIVSTSRIIGFEPLLRWIRANDESIPPSDFIPLAEEEESISEIRAWVVDQTLSTLRATDAAKNTGIPLTMSLNVSARPGRAQGGGVPGQPGGYGGHRPAGQPRDARRDPRTPRHGSFAKH